MTKPLILNVNGKPVRLSGLRIDKAYGLRDPAGPPRPVNVLHVENGQATVRTAEGQVFDIPATNLMETRS